MHNSRQPMRHFKGPQRQGGMIAMIIAIIVLVSTLLAVIGLMRSVDTSSMIAGTMSFKQGVVQEAERAYTVVKSNVPFGGVRSESDELPNAYSASILAADLTRKDIPRVLTSFATNAPPPPSATIVQTLSTQSTQNKVYYVVDRLCRTAGPATKLNCIIPGAYNTGGTVPDPGIGLSGALAAYRLTVRIDGPKNTQAYVQTTLR